MNKNFSMSKFLIPIGVAMLVLDAVSLFSGFVFNLSPSLSKFLSYVLGYSLFFGFTFFIVGLIDLHITRKRNINSGLKMQNLSLPNVNSPWIRIGIIIILTVICFMALMYAALRAFHD